MASTNVNVRLSGKLKEHLDNQIADDGQYENASEYVRDIIRHDLQEQDKAWEWLRNHLEPAILANDSEYLETHSRKNYPGRKNPLQTILNHEGVSFIPTGQTRTGGCLVLYHGAGENSRQINIFTS